MPIVSKHHMNPTVQPPGDGHSGEVNKQEQRRELWRQRIAQQENSGQSVRAFCREQELSEPTFYAWRQRLGTRTLRSRFALVEAKPAADAVPPIELMLASGERLRIPARRRDAQAGAGGAAGPGVIHLPASVRVYLCTSPCDMRRSFDGLHALVSGAMQLDAFAGHLFCFPTGGATG